MSEDVRPAPPEPEPPEPPAQPEPPAPQEPPAPPAPGPAGDAAPPLDEPPLDRTASVARVEQARVQGVSRPELRDWTDAEVLAALEARNADTWPAQQARLRAEAVRRGLEVTGPGTLLRDALGAQLRAPGGTLLIAFLGALPLVGWPLFVSRVLWPLVVRLTGVDAFQGMSGYLMLTGWGAAAGLACLLPALLALALQSARREPRSLEAALRALRHAPTAVAGLAIAVNLAAPALLAGVVPCAGGWLVLSLWTALFLSAGAATCLSIERGLDPLAALAALREAERRRGTSVRAGFALLLGGIPFLLVILLFVVGNGARSELFLLVGSGCLALASFALLHHAAATLHLGLVGALERMALLAPRWGGAGVPARLRRDDKPEANAKPEVELAPRCFAPPEPGPAWLPWLALPLLLLPLGTPFWGPALWELLQASELPLATWAAIPTVHAVGLVGGLALLRAHQRGRRAVVMDRAGLLLDVGPDWPGTRLGWLRLRGYALEEDGVRLVVEGRWLSRWLGPLVPARDRDAHDLVTQLEQRRVQRL